MRQIEQQEPIQQNPERYLIKSVRADKLNYWDAFCKMITGAGQIPLRTWVEKSAYAFNGDGIYDRFYKDPQYDAEEIKGYSKPNSTTLVTPSCTPPLFGTHHGREKSLSGVMIDLKHAILTQRLLSDDRGTVLRVFDADSEVEAIDSFIAATCNDNAYLYADLEKLSQKIVNRKNANRHSELMVRIRWDIDGISKIIIGSDTLAMRLLAQDYSRILSYHLKQRAEREGALWDNNYRVPICFYQPDSEKHLKEYDHVQQHTDRLIAKEYYEYSPCDINKYNKDNYEYLLTLENTNEVITQLCTNGESLFVKILNDGYAHIAQSLLERCNDPDILSKIRLSETQQFHKNAIYYASNIGSIKLVIWLAPYFSTGENKLWTSLRTAVEKNHVDIVKILINYDLLLVIKSSSICGSLLKVAANAGSWDCVKVIINAYPRLKPANINDNIQFIAATYAQYIIGIGAIIVRIFPEFEGFYYSVTTETRDANFANIVVQAAQANRMDVMHALIHIGTPVDKNHQNITALHWVIRHYQHEMMRLLIIKSPQLLQVKSRLNKSPSQLLCEQIYEPLYTTVWNILEEKPEIQNHCDLSMLLSMIINLNKSNQFAHVFNKHSKSQFIKDYFGEELITKLINEHLSILLVMIKQVDSNPAIVKEHVIGTAILFAAEKNNITALRILLAESKEVNYTYIENGFSPLHWAFYHHNELMQKLLIMNDADINKTDHKNRRPHEVLSQNISDLLPPPGALIEPIDLSSIGSISDEFTPLLRGERNISINVENEAPLLLNIGTQSRFHFLQRLLIDYRFPKTSLFIRYVWPPMYSLAMAYSLTHYKKIFSSSYSAVSFITNLPNFEYNIFDFDSLMSHTSAPLATPVWLFILYSTIYIQYKFRHCDYQFYNTAATLEAYSLQLSEGPFNKNKGLFYLLPMLPFHLAFNHASFNIANNKLLSFDERRHLFKIVLTLATKESYFPRLYALNCVADIIAKSSTQLIEFDTLIKTINPNEEYIAKHADEIAFLKQIQKESLHILNEAASRDPIYTHYLRWTLNLPVNWALQLLYYATRSFIYYTQLCLTIKLIVFFGSIADILLYKLYNNWINPLIERHMCITHDSIWSYYFPIMQQICSACGDLPYIFPGDIAYSQRCLDSLLQRSLPEIITTMPRLINQFSSLQIDTLKIDLSHQNITSWSLNDTNTFIKLLNNSLSQAYSSDPQILVDIDLANHLNNTIWQMNDMRIAYLATMLAQWPLNKLSLRNQLFGSINIQMLIQLLQRGNSIQYLDLSGNNIDDTVIPDIANFLALSSNITQVLDVSNNNISDVGMTVLAKSLSPNRYGGYISGLKCGRNPIGQISLNAISQAIHQNTTLFDFSGINVSSWKMSTFWTAVRKMKNAVLDFSHTGFTDVNAEDINIATNDTNNTQSQLYNSFERLDFSHNHLTGAGATNILQNLGNKTISLSLNDNPIDDNSLNQMIAAGPSVFPQQQLELAGCNYNGTNLTDFMAQLTNTTNITAFNFARNNLGDGGPFSLLFFIQHSSSFGKQFYFDLSHNNISDQGARYFFDLIATLNITETFALNFAHNNITDHAMHNLAHALSKITYLNLNFNHIGAKGAELIAAKLYQSPLSGLLISHNPLGNNGTAAIAEALIENVKDKEIYSAINISTTDRQLLAKAHPASSIGDFQGLFLPFNDKKALDLENTDMTTESALLLCRFSRSISKAQTFFQNNHEVNNTIVNLKNCEIYSDNVAPSSSGNLMPSQMIKRHETLDLLSNTHALVSTPFVTDSSLPQITDGTMNNNSQLNTILAASLTSAGFAIPIMLCVFAIYQICRGINYMANNRHTFFHKPKQNLLPQLAPDADNHQSRSEQYYKA